MKRIFTNSILSFLSILAFSATAANLETIATFPDARPGNPAVSPDGRLFVTMSALSGPEVNVVEILSNGETKAFPSEEWAGKPKSSSLKGINATIGLQVSSDGVLWVLDMGNSKAKPAQPPKLVGWDLESGELVRMFVIPQPVLRSNSFLQDFAIDEKNKIAVIADMTQPFASDTGPAPSNPAFVVINLETGMTRRVLENHESFKPSGDAIVIGGKPVTHKPKNGPSFKPKYPLNPIAVSPDFEWIYYGAMGNTKVYRIPSKMLADDTVPSNELEKNVEYYVDKPFTDGFDVDSEGNVYVTDVENYAVGVVSQSNEYKILATDEEKLTWPDGVALSNKGWLYIVANELNTLAALNNGKDITSPPFYVHRLKVEGKR